MDPKKKEEIDAELERQEQERNKIAEEQRKMLEEQRRLAQEAAEKNAKAEGMLEAVKTFQQMQANNGGKREWSKEEWDAFTEKTGFTKEGITAIDSAVTSRLTEAEHKFQELARKAEERAKLAEERVSQIERGRTYESQKRDFLSTRPQFARYEKDFSEFVDEFPTEMKSDPEKLKKIFEKAEVYIKGKVGDKMMKKDFGGSNRFGSGDNDSREEEDETVDLSDLRSHERALVEKIVPSKEKRDMLKNYKHDLKGENGVMYNSRSEWDKYNKK